MGRAETHVAMVSLCSSQCFFRAGTRAVAGAGEVFRELLERNGKSDESGRSSNSAGSERRDQVLSRAPRRQILPCRHFLYQMTRQCLKLRACMSSCCPLGAAPLWIGRDGQSDLEGRAARGPKRLLGWRRETQQLRFAGASHCEEAQAAAALTVLGHHAIWATRQRGPDRA